MDLLVVDAMLPNDTMLPRSRNPQGEIWAVYRAQIGRKKVWRFSCCTCAARRAGALSCWNTKSLPDIMRISGSSMTSL